MLLSNDTLHLSYLVTSAIAPIPNRMIICPLPLVCNHESCILGMSLQGAS